MGLLKRYGAAFFRHSINVAGIDELRLRLVLTCYTYLMTYTMTALSNYTQSKAHISSHARLNSSTYLLIVI